MSLGNWCGCNVVVFFVAQVVFLQNVFQFLSSIFCVATESHFSYQDKPFEYALSNGCENIPVFIRKILEETFFH